MSAISTILTRLRAAIWAIDVRDDIANAIEQCYSDVSNPTLQTEALEAALQTKIDEGEMAALTIGDHTITAAKLAQGVIDNTLTTSGAAADAKKTGDEIAAVKANLDTQTSGLKQALLPFIEHLVGAFDDENGGEYTENLLAVLRAGTPEPVVNMVKSENIIGTSAQLFTDEGTTEQASLKTSGSRYYYLDAPAEEDCTYKVTITITTDLNSFRYGAVYAYNGELISGKGTATPTAYNLTSTKEGGIISVADPNPDLTEDYVFETQISVKANRNPAIMFYRDYDSCIGSVTAQKVG